ncbi:MAG: recombinase family protein [Anaerolineales bacterium]|nr:recombinase family protein [Anaerolineales bacterium]
MKSKKVDDVKGLLAPTTAAELEKMVAGILRKEDAPGGETWAVYTRLSRVDPRNPGYSLEIQPDRAEEYARAHGAQHVVVYSDPARTGRNSRRPELQRMLRDIKAGKIQVVVIHRLDRCYRNLESMLKFIRLLRRYNVRLASVTENIDTDTWWGRVVLCVLGIMAEAYVWQVSARTREAKAERVRRGLANGNIPFGYCNGLCSDCADPNGPGYCPFVGNPDRSESSRGRVPVPHPVDQHAVRLMAALYHQGMSYREIAEYLETHTFRLPDGSEVRFRTRGIPGRCEPQPFKRDSVRAVLENPFHAGVVALRPHAPLDMEDDPENPEQRSEAAERVPKRQILELQPGQHLPLYSVRLWESNQQLRRQKGSTSHTASRPMRIYPLSGVARCWECYAREGRQASLRGSRGGRGETAYYRCAALHDSYRSRQRRSEVDIEPALAATGLGAQPEGENPASWHATLHSDRLEAQVDRLVARLAIPAEWHERILAYYLSEEGLTEFERQGYNLRQELARQQALFERGYIDLTKFEQCAGQVQRQLNALQPSSRPEARAVLPVLADFAGLWRQTTDGEKRVLLQVIFAGLYFDAQGALRKAMTRSPFDRLLGLA